MRWFAASLFLRSIHTPPIEAVDEVWEECIYLVAAETSHQALEEAEKIGLSLQTSYTTASADVATWLFVKVERIVEISTLEAGQEIFSRFLKRAEAESLLKSID